MLNGVFVVSPLGSRKASLRRLPAPESAGLSLGDEKRDCEWGEQTLKQACFQEYPEAQHAFKDLMIHGILQFTLRIAFRCVLHRCENQDIHC